MTGDAVAANEQKDDIELGTAKSGTSTSNESTVRTRAERYFETWRESIMAQDLSDLHVLRWRILFSVLLIVVFSSVCFCLIDVVLFGSVAQAVIDLDRKARDFRPDIVDSNFLLRSMFLSAIKEESESSDSLRAMLAELATSFSSQHLENFQSAPSGLNSFYQNPIWTLYLPIGACKS